MLYHHWSPYCHTAGINLSPTTSYSRRHIAVIIMTSLYRLRRNRHRLNGSMIRWRVDTRDDTASSRHSTDDVGRIRRILPLSDHATPPTMSYPLPRSTPNRLRSQSCKQRKMGKQCNNVGNAVSLMAKFKRSQQRYISRIFPTIKSPHVNGFY